MKVKDLQNILSGYDGDLTVCFKASDNWCNLEAVQEEAFVGCDEDEEEYFAEKDSVSLILVF